MEDGRLNQRLVGALVLVALAVIFIPMLLNGGNDMEMPVFGSNVPERSPEIKNIKHIDIKEMKQTKLHQVNPPRIPIAEELPEPKITTGKNSKAIEDTALSSIVKKNKPLINKNVWAVQVGSFNNRKNALGLKERLRLKKVSAFVERVIKSSKAVYRVRVGPVITRKKAETLKVKLKKEFKLSGLIVKHP